MALTPIVFKCFEKIVRNRLVSQTGHLMDPNQFAYRNNRNVEDAVLLFVHNVLKHLEKPKTYVRALFVDFSSAFNTIQPHLMARKLLRMGVDRCTTAWIFDFLTNRQQYVKANGAASTMAKTNTGAPQGCVLSPVLYTIYTNDFRCNLKDTHLIKFADDSTVLGLISTSETNYFDSVRHFVNWCEENYLQVNVSKTKEIIFDFRRRKTQTTPLRINNELVQITDTYKYLGINIDQNLDWHAHTDALIKKMNQRLYFMRKLKSFKVSNNIIKLFYLSSIQSIILFGISCWGGNLTQTDKTRIDRLIRKSGKMLNCTFQSFDHLFRETVAKKGTNIIKDPNHPLCNEFRVSARSGRLLAIPARTERYKNSFVPTVSRILRE